MPVRTNGSQLVEFALNGWHLPPMSATGSPQQSGTVYLVGSGPGDPGLLTVRARQLLVECDAVVHDALVHPALLVPASVGRPRPYELYPVGKRGGGPSARQDDIETLLVRLGREGKKVVRLKGGDPFVFGRGSEEAQALAREGIPFEIVPGVTAGIAVPAYAGIPVTHRGLSTSVTLVTGHEDPAKGVSDTHWESLARVGGTLVVYMGVGRLEGIVRALVDAGMAEDTPAAAIAWGTYERQRVVEAPLAALPAAVQHESLGAPAIIVVGEVVRLRDEIGWFDRRALAGRRVIVTRARVQASELTARLRALGADVIEVPTIRIESLDQEPLRAALRRLESYEWLVVTSRNAAALIWEGLRALDRDSRALHGVRICAVGPGTADALLERGLAVDVLPRRFVAEGLVEALRGRSDVAGSRVLFPRAAGARELLPAELRDMGALVDEVEIYRTVPEAADAASARKLLETGAVDAVTFTSASTVRHFVDTVGESAAMRAKAISIGPVTSAAARDAGLDVAGEAAEARIESLVSAVAEALHR